jgi:hypothetical protein
MSGARDFPAFLAEVRPAVDAALDALLPAAETPPGRLHEALRYAVFAGGKRFRPSLVLLAGARCGAPRERLLPGAAAIELIHTYSLVHDDLPALDDDALRRGRPTVHRAFDEATAILAGDALLTLGLTTLAARPASVPAAARAAAVAMVGEAIGTGGMIGGQAEDLAAESAWPADAAGALDRIHLGKTAALIGAALRLGGLYAGAGAEVDAALAGLGRRLGRADRRPPLRLRHPPRPPRLGRQPPVLPAQGPDGPPGPPPHDPAEGGPLGLHEPERVGVRRLRGGPRLDLDLGGPRDGRGPRCQGGRLQRGRDHRRRRPDRRRRDGGAEPGRLPEAEAHRHPERQRDVDRPERRGDVGLPPPDRARAVLQQGPRRGGPRPQEAPQGGEARRDGRAPRGRPEEGARPGHPLRGARVQVRRADRRPQPPRPDRTLREAKEFDGPILVHARTTKGKGYALAEKDPVFWHGPSPFKVETGEIAKKAAPPSYTAVFADTLAELAAKDDRIVAITAAMPDGTGLDRFGKRFPDRTFDVGICEQHAVLFAAGMATQGMKPVCAIYSTFLQRAYDQIFHDVCLMDLPVVFALDRGGVVGSDGPTHHGAYDLSYLRVFPNMMVAAPKDENELRNLVATALTTGHPTAIRYPRGAGHGVALDAEPKLLPIGKQGRGPPASGRTASSSRSATRSCRPSRRPSGSPRRGERPSPWSTRAG